MTRLGEGSPSLPKPVAEMIAAMPIFASLEEMCAKRLQEMLAQKLPELLQETFAEMLLEMHRHGPTRAVRQRQLESDI